MPSMPAAADTPWPAPAKLNLCLHVTGRRTDGYHELETVFQLLDHGDQLYFTVREDRRIRRVSGPVDIAPAQDLCMRAASVLQQAAGVRHGVDLRLDKRLPTAAGLGGGSSDAATTLLALNRLWGCELPLDALAALGLQLGADVPVFVRGHSAYARGVGEVLTPLALGSRWYVVLTPPVSVSTGALFAASELTRDTPVLTIAGFVFGAGRNDFEPLLRAREPQVAAALDWLGRHAPARLTGTGGSVFAAFATERQARAVLQQAPAAWRGFVARGVDRSPVLARLAAARPSV